MVFNMAPYPPLFYIIPATHPHGNDEVLVFVIKAGGGGTEAGITPLHGESRAAWAGNLANQG